MTVKDIVCDSITMRAQGCPWFAMWSLDFMKVNITSAGAVDREFLYI